MSSEKCQCGHIHSEHLFGICMATGYLNTCHCMSWRPDTSGMHASRASVPPEGDEQPEPVYPSTTDAERGGAGFEHVHVGDGEWGWRKARGVA